MATCTRMSSRARLTTSPREGQPPWNWGARVIRLGGSPLAEHGVGRNAVKQQLLQELYSREGVNEMRRVKRALDPQWKLAPGVVFPRRT